MNIDWSRLQKNKKSQEASFESLWYHVVKRMFDKIGIFDDGYNMPGSEFFVKLTTPFNFEGVELHPADVIGWQCKYWLGVKDPENSPLDGGHIRELVEGFEKTVNEVASLKVWVVCTPGKFVYQQKSKLEEQLKEINPDVQIIYWHGETVENLCLRNRSSYLPILSYFFTGGPCLIELIRNYSLDVLETLRSKYDTDLHQPTTFETEYLELSAEEGATEYITQRLKKWEKRRKKLQFPGDGSLWDKVNPKFREKYCELWTVLQGMVDNALLQLRSSKNLLERAQIVSENVDAQKNHVNVLLNAYSGIENKIPSVYNYELSDLLSILLKSDGSDRGIIPAVRLLSNQMLHVFSPAGGGKTHFCCSIVERCLQEGKVVLFFKGSSFSYEESAFKNTVGNLLGIYPYEFHAFLDQLEFIGEMLDDKVTIVIDGLNESRLSKDGTLWVDELNTLRRYLDKCKHLRFISSCRDNEIYIQYIYGKRSLEEVPNHIELYGFESKHLRNVVQKYFTKYNILVDNPFDYNLFSHPLSLKMFCEANKAMHFVNITENSLICSLQTNLGKLINDVSNAYGAKSRKVRHTLEKKLNKLSLHLWKENLREVPLYDTFDDYFEDTADTLIEEGLFTKNIDAHEEKIQFSYDRMAGYCIAFALVRSCSRAELLDWLISEEAHNKLLNPESGIQHPLAEDICLSLFHIFNATYGQQLFNLVHTEWLDVQSLRYIMASDLDECHEFLATVEVTPTLSRIFLVSLSEKTKQRRYVHYSRLLPLIVRIPQQWLDIHWQMRMDFYDVHLELKSLFSKIKIFDPDIFCLALLMSGTFDIQKRCQYLTGAILMATNDILGALEVIQPFVEIHDPCIYENLFVILLGLIFREQDQRLVHACLTKMNVLLSQRSTTNAVVLDCVETALAYSQHIFGITVSMPAPQASFPKPPIPQTNLYDYLDYDFIKENIRHYSADYNDIQTAWEETYIKEQVISLMQKNGFVPEVYHQACEMKKDILTDSGRYRLYQSCAQKSARSALLEIVGWMLHMGIVHPEYINTFRTSEHYFDPSYQPVFPKVLLFSKSLLCHDNRYAQWVKTSPLSEFRPYFKMTIEHIDEEMVMIYGQLSQVSESEDQRFRINILSRLNDNSNDLVTHHYHKFMGEIGWRSLEIGEDYGAPIPLVSEYVFTSWSPSERMGTHSIVYLSDVYGASLNLHFNVSDHSWYNAFGVQVTKLYYSDTSQFLYMRKSYLMQILEENKYRFTLQMLATKTHKGVENGHKRFYEKISDIL